MIELAIATVLGGILNRVRGGLIKTLTGIKVPGAIIAAVALAGAVFWLSANWIAALAVGAGYVLGECFGWTKWINCIPCVLTQEEYNATWPADKTGKNDGTRFVAGLFADERKNYKLYCFAGMTARGLLWWAPVFAALWWFNIVSPVVAIAAVVGLAVAFPVLYWLAWRATFIPNLGKTNAYLNRAELLYGLVYGAVLGFAVL